MTAKIRTECLRPYSQGWEQPTGDEIRQVLHLAGFSGKQAAKALGLGDKGDRTVRRWVGEDSSIPYAAWALLCSFADLGLIWQDLDRCSSEVKRPGNVQGA